MAKGILEEIRSQPSHIREVFMWVSVVIVFSVVGFSWFRTTSKQFVALVNPEQAQQNADMLAEDQDNKLLPFATISKSWKSLSAGISELFDFTQKTNSIQIENKQSEVKIKPNLLPLAGDK
jgi:hypothetical protein